MPEEKIFSWRAFLISVANDENMSYANVNRALNQGWIEKAEGKTQDECTKMNILLMPSWMVNPKEYGNN